MTNDRLTLILKSVLTCSHHHDRCHHVCLLRTGHHGTDTNRSPGRNCPIAGDRRTADWRSGNFVTFEAQTKLLWNQKLIKCWIVCECSAGLIGKKVLPNCNNIKSSRELLKFYPIIIKSPICLTLTRSWEWEASKKFLEYERCSFYRKFEAASLDQLANITLLIVWLVSKNLAKTTLFVKLKSFLFYVVIMTFLFESYFFHYIIHIGVYFRHYIWAYIWRNMSWSQVIGVEKGWKLS